MVKADTLVNLSLGLAVVAIAVLVCQLRWLVRELNSSGRVLSRVLSFVQPMLPGQKVNQAGPCAIVGRVGVEAGIELLKAPMSNTPCVYFRTLVLSCESKMDDFKKNQFGDGSGLHDGEWQIIAEEKGCIDFYLSEQPGSHMPRIKVDAGHHPLVGTGLDTPDGTFGYCTTGSISRSHPKALAFLGAQADAHAIGTMRYEETVVCPEAVVLVIGHMNETDDERLSHAAQIGEIVPARQDAVSDSLIAHYGGHCGSRVLARRAWQDQTGHLTMTSHRSLLGEVGLSLLDQPAVATIHEDVPDTEPLIGSTSYDTGEGYQSATKNYPRMADGSIDFYAENGQEQMRPPEKSAGSRGFPALMSPPATPMTPLGITSDVPGAIGTP